MPTDLKSKIHCVLPCYNESKTIAKIIAELKSRVDKIIVVDDGSTDETFVLAKAGGADALRHAVNRGQGAALQTGDDYAVKNGADIIVHFDADGQFLTDEIPDIIKPLVEGKCDIVFGSRFLGKKSNIPLFKRICIFPLARIFNRFFLKIKLTDPQCGFRAFKAGIAGKLVIERDGGAHCSEIMEKVFDQKIKYKEIPVTVVYRHYGVKFNGGVKIAVETLLSKIIN